MAEHRKPDQRQRLLHMVNAINKCIRFTDDITLEEFQQDEVIQLALIKLFEIIGEASYQLDSTFKDLHPNIAWRKIEGLRHVLVHDYYRVDPIILWNTKESYLVSLRLALSKIIEAL